MRPEKFNLLLIFPYQRACFSSREHKQPRGASFCRSSSSIQQTHTTSSVRLWLLLRNVFGRLRAATQKNATAKSGALRYSGGCCFSYIFDAKQRVKRALAVSLFSLARTYGGVGGACKDVRDWRSCLAGKL
jgi:hypothetical protein